MLEADDQGYSPAQHTPPPDAAPLGEIFVNPSSDVQSQCREINVVSRDHLLQQILLHGSSIQNAYMEFLQDNPACNQADVDCELEFRQHLAAKKPDPERKQLPEAGLMLGGATLLTSPKTEASRSLDQTETRFDGDAWLRACIAASAGSKDSRLQDELITPAAPTPIFPHIPQAVRAGAAATLVLGVLGVIATQPNRNASDAEVMPNIEISDPVAQVDSPQSAEVLRTELSDLREDDTSAQDEETDSGNNQHIYPSRNGLSTVPPTSYTLVEWSRANITFLDRAEAQRKETPVPSLATAPTGHRSKNYEAYTNPLLVPRTIEGEEHTSVTPFPFAYDLTENRIKEYCQAQISSVPTADSQIGQIDKIRQRLQHCYRELATDPSIT